MAVASRRFARVALATTLATTLAGCAHGGATDSGGRGARASAPDPVAVASRMYTAGEQRLAQGDPASAVELWRGAIEALPPTEDSDLVRHKLVLRLGYGHMVAYQQSGQLEYLFGGKRMLERYLVRHEQLFGDDAAARAARGEVFEVLYQIESLVETPPAEHAESAVDVLEDAPRVEPSGDDDEGLHRTVVVERRRDADIDDPALRRALVDWNPDPRAPAVLTRPGVEGWIPARVYVRLDGPPRLVEGTAGRAALHEVAASLVRGVRPRLRRCYESAYARKPRDYATVQLALTIDRDGTITAPEIRDPGLTDAAADACMLRGLRSAEVDRDAAGVLPSSTRLTIALLFFYDETIEISEAHGRTPVGLDPPPQDPAAEPHG